MGRLPTAGIVLTGGKYPKKQTRFKSALPQTWQAETKTDPPVPAA
jgi:hypothetical protein